MPSTKYAIAVLALALCAMGPATAQDVSVGKPAYDEIGNALIFPIGNTRAKLSGLVGVSLDDFEASAVPIPCGFYPFRKLAFLDQGKIMAAWGSPASKPANLQPGNARLPEQDRFWQPYEVIFLARGDWRVVHKLDIEKPLVLNRKKPTSFRHESISDMNAPDNGETLFFAIDRPLLTNAPAAIYGLSIRDWQMRLLWPTKAGFNYLNDDSFMSLSAPKWFEDGSWDVRGTPRDDNKEWNVPKEKRHHKNHWLINPSDQSVRLHPHNDILHYGFTVQKIDDGVYMDEIIAASGPNMAFEYGLKRVLPPPERLLGSLGGASNWVYLFSGRGKRYVVWQRGNGHIALRSLPEFKEVGSIDTSRFASFARRWECPALWNP